MNKRESVLFSNGKLIVFACIALLALVLAFPGKQLFSQLNSKPVDIASLAYTRAAFKREPNNPELRLRLVEKLYEINQIKEALSILKPLTSVPEPMLAASELHIKLLFRVYFDVQQEHQKQVVKRLLIKDLRRVTPQITKIPMLEELAELSLQLGEPIMAANIYRQIIQVYDAQPAQHKDQRNVIFGLLGINSAYAEEAKPKTFYIQKQLQSLLAANRGAEAFKWAQYYVNRYPKDATVLRMAIEIAQSQNEAIYARDWGRLLFDLQETADLPGKLSTAKPLHNANDPLQRQLQNEMAADQLDDSVHWITQQVTANPHSEATLLAAYSLAKRQGNKALLQQWGAQLVHLKPKDTELVQQQIDAEMAAADLKKAQAYAQYWVQLAPENVAAHGKLADVALWAGDTDKALEQRLWLYQHAPQPEGLEKTIALATALFKHDVVADLYANLAKSRQLTEQELERSFKALQSSGRADAGETFWQTYVMLWPGQEGAWRYLAKTQDLLGKITAASQTTAHITERFQPGTALILQQVGFLVKLGKLPEAWQVLRKAAATVPVTDVTFWNKYVALAFQVGAETDLLAAYQKNPAVSRDKPMLNYYLLSMLRQKEDVQQYSKFAQYFFKQDKSTTTLLDLISFHIQRQQWSEARSVLLTLDGSDSKVRESSQYWLAKAEVDGHFNDKPMALADIKTALQLDPASASTRSLLIWHLLAENRTEALARCLEESQGYAQANAELWEAMAAGYRALGKGDAAKQWYAKALQQWPNRQSVIMGYADALQDQPVKARQLWRYITAHFQPGANPLGTKASDDTASFDRRYAELVRLYLGVEASEKWRKWLEQHQALQNAGFSEFRIAWFLAQQRPEQAKALMTSAQQNGVVIPPWQRLAMAMTENDTATTRSILKAKGSQLNKLDEIAALRSVGEEGVAYQKTKALLNTQQSEAELAVLRKQAIDLAREQQNGWAVGVKTHNVSQLAIVQDGAEVAWTHGKHRFLGSYQDLFYSTDDHNITIADKLRHEQVLATEWRYLNPRYQSSLKVAGHLRGDQQYASVESNFNYLLHKGWNARVEAGYNVLSTEGAVFRLAGLTDKFEARLTGEFSKREYLSLDVVGQRYKTRGGQHLGYGYGAGFEAGYRVFFEKPEVVLAVHGNWKKSAVPSQLPAEWNGIVAADSRMDNIINKAYNEVGVDLRLKEGEFKPFGYMDRSFRYFLDAGAFYNGSSGNFGTKVQGGIGTRLFDGDEIGLSGYYSSVQGSVQSEPSTALELRYSKRFD